MRIAYKIRTNDHHTFNIPKAMGLSLTRHTVTVKISSIGLCLSRNDIVYAITVMATLFISRYVTNPRAIHVSTACVIATSMIY